MHKIRANYHRFLVWIPVRTACPRGGRTTLHLSESMGTLGMDGRRSCAFSVLVTIQWSHSELEVIPADIELKPSSYGVQCRPINGPQRFHSAEQGAPHSRHSKHRMMGAYFVHAIVRMSGDQATRDMISNQVLSVRRPITERQHIWKS